MWGIIPAAGQGTRIQPLAFSKELLPVGMRVENGAERPRAVSEYLVERLARGGADKVCFVISPHKDDILRYFSDRVDGVDFAFVVQPRPAGLCDAIFRAAPVIPADEPVAVGLPDTIWFPEDALAHLPDDRFSFLTFPVEEPRHFDAVVADPDGRIREIQVKVPNAASKWIWGAFKMPGRIFHELHALWLERGREDEYLGTLVNAWIAAGGEAWNAPLGSGYVDVGTVDGYRQALRLLGALEPVSPRP
ncbi:nucleotidyltransferase family protein [Phenylobacterium sp.]|jgi:dTDP-glucose pyrophosphorylase|uniref:nucleotidyltransferase family protein n=1 Tax=Phenylobacterium sp. TaxID=1871053 RepID=UPI002F9520D7